MDIYSQPHLDFLLISSTLIINGSLIVLWASEERGETHIVPTSAQPFITYNLKPAQRLSFI